MKENTSFRHQGIAFFFLIGILYSQELWIRTQEVPLLPLIMQEHDGLVWISNIISGIVLMALLVIIVYPRRQLVGFSLIALICVIILDEMKMQPWVYFYGFFLLSMLIKDQRGQLTFLRVIILGLYVLSGLSKMNIEFGDVVLKLIIPNPNFPRRALLFLGYLMGGLEIALGILLVTKRWKSYSVLLLTIMHLAIILWLIFWSPHENYIVIPWNLAMIFVLITCVLKAPSHHLMQGLKSINCGYKFLLFNFLVVLPLTSWWFQMNNSLRFDLYSSGYTRIYMAIKDNGFFLDGMTRHKVALEGLEGGSIIDLNAWVNDELKVPMLSNQFLYQRLIDQLCQPFGNQEVLFILPVSESKIDYMSCGHE